MRIETLSSRNSKIIYGPEDLPSETTFEELIKKVGGKAAGLLWIQRYLPHIPQARMIVAPVGTPAQEIITAAKEQQLSEPWIIRASTPIDNLPGMENAFQTVICMNEGNAKGIIDRVKIEGVSESHPFTETSIILAEYSKSRIRGTLVGHPHINDKLLAGITAGTWPLTSNGFYSIDQGNSAYWEDFSKLYNEKYAPSSVPDDLSTLYEWYYQIKSLPGITPEMTYQLEFGLNPLLLFQLRDFMPVQHADFQIESSIRLRDDIPGYNPIVFGITPPEGIEVIVYNKDEEDHKNGHEGVGKPFDDYDSGNEFPDNNSICLVTSPSFTHYIHFPTRANIFYYAGGLLQHEDIRRMRESQVTIVNASGLDFPSGTTIKIISDGIRVNITKVK